MGRLVIGVDVGGTKLAGLALADGTEAALATCTAALDASPLDVQVLHVVHALLADAGARDGDLGAVGLAVPGQVDAARGVMRLAVNLEPRELAIGPAVEAALGVPCFIEHDARAVAAWLAANGHGPDLAYLSVGTGVSAGIVLGGEVVRGAAGLAGEVGHLVAEPAGPLCKCGLRGCLEAMASGPAIARAAGNGAGAEGVFRAATAGDTEAEAIVERAAGYLARAIRGLVLAFGVGRVVVGGGVARAGASLREPLLAAVAAERARSPLLARALPAGSVRFIEDPRPIGALSAAAVARIGLGGRAGLRKEVAPP